MKKAGNSTMQHLSPFEEASERDSRIRATALSDQEKGTIARRLHVNMLGAGLLFVGLIVEWVSVNQTEVSQLIQAAAALVVSMGLFGKAIRGFLANPTRDFTEQLVALAVLAAMAAGDFVSAALVPLLLDIGHLFEERSALGAQTAISRLRSLCTRQATVIVNGKEQTVPSEAVAQGSTVIVRPGEIIPADGKVILGHASLDQSPVTGESDPNDVKPGDAVYTGTINLDGVLHVEVERTGPDTVLGEVIRILREVEEAKLPVVRLLERGASLYLPVVISLAAVVLLTTGELSRFVTVLVVACPCALVLAAPAALVAAMSAATRQSVLIKNAAFLERISSVDTLILDKTGTITHGRQSFDALTTMGGFGSTDALRLAAAVAQGSRHPASLAIANEASRRALNIPQAHAYQEYSGRGVEANVEGVVVRIGRASWLRECGVEGVVDNDAAGAWVAQGDTAIGFVSLFDRARLETEQVISDLRTLGFRRIVLLTGDKETAAQRIADQLGLDKVVAEVLPAEKLAEVRREQQCGRTVLMVGDGVNDALALSAADVGIAVGGRINDVALGGADVAILSDDLTRLPFAVRLADRTRHIIFENVVGGVALSTGLLALASLGVINPLAGALLHNAGAIFVVLNSARLLDGRQVHDTAADTGDGKISHAAEPKQRDGDLPDLARH